MIRRVFLRILTKDTAPETEKQVRDAVEKLLPGGGFLWIGE